MGGRKVSFLLSIKKRWYKVSKLKQCRRSVSLRYGLMFRFISKRWKSSSLWLYGTIYSDFGFYDFVAKIPYHLKELRPIRFRLDLRDDRVHRNVTSIYMVRVHTRNPVLRREVCLHLRAPEIIVVPWHTLRRYYTAEGSPPRWKVKHSVACGGRGTGIPRNRMPARCGWTPLTSVVRRSASSSHRTKTWRTPSSPRAWPYPVPCRHEGSERRGMPPCTPRKLLYLKV